MGGIQTYRSTRTRQDLCLRYKSVSEREYGRLPIRSRVLSSVCIFRSGQRRFLRLLRVSIIKHLLCLNYFLQLFDVGFTEYGHSTEVKSDLKKKLCCCARLTTLIQCGVRIIPPLRKRNPLPCQSRDRKT